MNFHKDFVDLNPDYAHQRHLRAKKLGQVYMKSIGNKLMNRVRNEEVRIFGQEFEKGRTLSY